MGAIVLQVGCKRGMTATVDRWTGEATFTLRMTQGDRCYEGRRRDRVIRYACFEKT